MASTARLVCASPLLTHALASGSKTFTTVNTLWVKQAKPIWLGSIGDMTSLSHQPSLSDLAGYLNFSSWLMKKKRYLNRKGSSSSSSSSIFHGIWPLVDPFRSHASRSLFNGLPWFLPPVGKYCFITPGIYRVSQEECARLREGVPYVKVYRYNPKHLCPKLNGYGDKSARKIWSSCGSTYCTWFAWRNTHTLRIVRPCLQTAQARSSLRLHM